MDKQFTVLYFRFCVRVPKLCVETYTGVTCGHRRLPGTKTFNGSKRQNTNSAKTERRVDCWGRVVFVFFWNTSQWCSLSLSAGGCCWRTGRSEHPPVNFFHSFYSTARKAIRFVKTKHKTNWELVSKKHLFCVYVFTRAWTFFDQFSVSRRSCSVPTTSKTCFSRKTGSSGVLGVVLESFGADIGSLPKSHNLA